MGLIVLESLIWGASFDLKLLPGFCRLLLNRRNQATIFLSFDQEENLSMISVTGSRVDALTVYTAFSDLISGSSSGIALVAWTNSDLM